MDDRQIVELFLQRDEAAIAGTSEKYGRKLRALAFGITEDAQTAEECENDTYLQAWNLIPPHDPASYLYAFLARITRHLSLDACRSRSRLKRSAFVVELAEELEECVSSGRDTEREVEGALLGQAVSRYLRTLPEEKRNVFVCRYWYLDSVAVIAKRYRLTESKVKTMLFRVRGGLREFLEKEGYTL